MKKTTLLGFIASIFIFYSCGEIREEITIDKDGGGKYEVSSDMIPMLKTMMTGIAKMTMPEDEALDSAALADKVEQLVWKDFPGQIDSVITLDDELPPEIKNDPEALAMLDKTTLYMRGGKDQGFMRTGLEFNFDNADDFKKFITMLEENSKKNKKTSAFGQSKTEMSITADSFRRTLENEGSLNTDSLALVMPMFKEMNMLTVINFAKKIDKVDLVHYTIVEQQDKSITLKYDFVKAMQSKDKSVIDIKLK